MREPKHKQTNAEDDPLQAHALVLGPLDRHLHCHGLGVLRVGGCLAGFCASAFRIGNRAAASGMRRPRHVPTITASSVSCLWMGSSTDSSRDVSTSVANRLRAHEPEDPRGDGVAEGLHHQHLHDAHAPSCRPCGARPSSKVRVSIEIMSRGVDEHLSRENAENGEDDDERMRPRKRVKKTDLEEGS